MAQIPRRYIDNYTKSLNKLSADAQAKLAADLAKIDFTADVATIREAVIARMEFYCGPYANMAAILAANFYDGLREISVGKKLGALAESGREPIATERAVRGIMQDVVDGKPEVAVGKLVSRADYEIKKSAGECVYRNGQRDPLKPKYARVPSGGETCRFCIMLASRGFVYHNAKQAGENGHYHANCDCRIVPGFDGDTVAGYDPQAYYDQYRKMLEGHEKESHYDLLTRNGKTTKRMYKTAEYDYNAALGVKNKKDRVSAKFATHDGTHDFKKFEDVKQYIYGATSKADMEHRYSVLGNLYGFDSEQMQSQAMKNAFRHVEKRYESRNSIGAVYSKVFAARDAEVAKANLDNLKQTQLVHIAGTKQNAKTAKDRGIEPSCFTMSEAEVHSLIKKHAGHGEPDALYANRWNRKEICTSDSIVGYIVNEHGDKIETRKFKIHYADNGVHAVPRYDDGGEPDDVG